MNFWDFERKRQLKELKYQKKATRAAYRYERRRLRYVCNSLRFINNCNYFNCKGKSMLWSLLFGLLLILWGLSQIIGTIFNIHIPVFGIIFGLFLLYLGIEFITGFSHWPKNCGNCKVSCNVQMHGAFLSTSHISIDSTALAQQNVSYSTIMGKSTIDMKNLTSEAIQATGSPLTVHIDTVMGKTDIILNKQIPTRIIAKGGCAKVTTPDDCTMIFGSHTYNSHPGQESLIIMYTSTALGETKITVE